VIIDLQMVLKVEKEIIGRHLTTGEKVLGHPVIIAGNLEVVGILTMRKNVNEELPFGF
jgi:hypothetical protein